MLPKLARPLLYIAVRRRQVLNDEMSLPDKMTGSVGNDADAGQGTKAFHGLRAPLREVGATPRNAFFIFGSDVARER